MSVVGSRQHTNPRSLRVRRNFNVIDQFCLRFMIENIYPNVTESNKHVLGFHLMNTVIQRDEEFIHVFQSPSLRQMDQQLFTARMSQLVNMHRRLEFNSGFECPGTHKQKNMTQKLAIFFYQWSKTFSVARYGENFCKMTKEDFVELVRYANQFKYAYFSTEDVVLDTLYSKYYRHIMSDDEIETLEDYMKKELENGENNIVDVCMRLQASTDNVDRFHHACYVMEIYKTMVNQKELRGDLVPDNFYDNFVAIHCKLNQTDDVIDQTNNPQVHSNDELHFDDILMDTEHNMERLNQEMACNNIYNTHEDHVKEDDNPDIESLPDLTSTNY